MSVAGIGNNSRLTEVQSEAGVNASSEIKKSGVTQLNAADYVGMGKKAGPADNLDLLPQPRAMTSARIKDTLSVFDKKTRGGVDIAVQVAVAEVAMQKELRAAEQTSKQKNLLAQYDNLIKQAGEMRAAGQDRFKAAVVTGALQIGSGMVSMAAGGTQYSMATTPGGSEAAAQAVGAIGSGAGNAITGTGTIAGGVFEKEAVGHDAQGKELGADLQKLQAHGSAAEESRTQARDAAKQVTELLRSMLEGETATVRKTV